MTKGKIKASKMLLLEYGQVSDPTDKGKGKVVDLDDPFVGLDDLVDDRNYKAVDDGKSKVVDEGKNKAVDEDKNKGVDEDKNKGVDEDLDDSDYLVDEENMVNEVAVDMRDFHSNIDSNVEFGGVSNRSLVTDNDPTVEEVEVEVIDNDEFSSAEDSGDGIENIRNRKLKKLRKKKAGNDRGVDVEYFYAGKEFGSRLEVTELVKKAAIETRRNLRVIKQDNIRVRAICTGSIVVFNDEDGQYKTVVPPAAVGPSESAGPSESVGPRPGSGPSRVTRSSGPSMASGASGGSQKKNLGTGRVFNVPRNEGRCPWVVYVAKVKGESTWVVKTYRGQHRCLQTREVKACTAGFLSQELVSQIESNPDIPIKAIQDQLQKKYALSISKMKAFRAKSQAVNKVRGDYMAQYEMLRDYCEELSKRNPGTTIRLDVHPEPDPEVDSRAFRRIYICLGALKEGFKAIGRNLLGLDGAFMSGPFPGQILTAVGLDPNNGIYPLAYAIVEAETTESWQWFLECLGGDLELGVMSNFTFVTDRQKGILPAIAKVFPCAEHRYCLRHIHENMKKQWRGKKYKDLLWKCASQTSVPYFERAMGELREFNKDAYNWLLEIPPQHWTRSHFSGIANSDVLLNNMCEVFNRQLKPGRDKPIISCLEYIREYLMRRIVAVKGVIAKSEGHLTPTATKLLEEIKTRAVQCNAIWNGSSRYEVSAPFSDQTVVDMQLRQCTCRKFEITGIPCKHITACIWNMAQNDTNVGIPERWVHPCYRLSTWKQVYSFHVEPVTGSIMWPKSEVPTSIRTPYHHTPVGRPKKKRRKGEFEMDDMVQGGKLTRKWKTVTCDSCKQMGHNKRSCKGQFPEWSKKDKNSGAPAAGVGTSGAPAAGVGTSGAGSQKGKKSAAGVGTSGGGSQKVKKSVGTRKKSIGQKGKEGTKKC